MIQNQNIQQQKMQVQIEELEKRVATLGKKVKEGANTQELQNQISQAQADIETMQTNLINATNIATGLQSQVQTNTSNISQNTNKSAGNSVKISNLTTRIDNAENNILALTGGIDVSELVKKVESIDEITHFDVFIFKDLKYGYTPTNKTLYTREHYFSSNKNSACFLKFYLSCTLNTSSTISVELYLNRDLIKTFEINAKNGNNTYCFQHEFNSEYFTKAIKLKLSSSEMITYNSLMMHIIGSNLRFFDYDREIKISCYDNYIYITRYYDDCIKYGKFSATDIIDINNLPNTLGYSDNLCEGSLFTVFFPYIIPDVINKKYTTYTDCILRETIDSNYYKFEVSNQTLTNKKSMVSTGSGGFSNTTVNYACSFFAYKDQLAYYNYSSLYSFTYAPSNYQCSKIGAWLTYAPIVDNYKLVNAPISFYRDSQFLGLHSNGYVYFIDSPISNKLIKLEKATDFTGYRQSDGSIKAYLSSNGNTNVYKFEKDAYGAYSIYTKLDSISNCDIVLETLNNKRIIHSNVGWSYE